MSEQIKAGDLVVVVKLKPCGHGLPGYTFIVGEVRPTRTGVHRCLTCGAAPPEGLIAVQAGSDDRIRSVPLWRLKRIPPLSELEGAEHSEEIKA